MKRDISSLTNLSPKLDIAIRAVERTDLWFRSYGYMAKLTVNESSALRRLDHAYIDRVIQARRGWGRRIRRQPGSWAGIWEPLDISDQDVAILHVLCDFFLKTAGSHRITIGWNTIYCYTDDFSVIERLHDLPFLAGLIAVSKVELKGKPNTVLLDHSDYQYRTYMKFLRLGTEIATSLKTFLCAQSDIKPSPSFKNWILGSNNILRDHYFIDHDSTSTIAMLNLINPTLVRKTLPIVVDK